MNQEDDHFQHNGGIIEGESILRGCVEKAPLPLSI